MSSQLECVFIERQKKWYIILENSNAPKDAWNWLEYATAYGSFKSFKIDKQFLDDNFANPGGYEIYEEGYYRKLPKRELYDDLLDHANKL
mgnify:CR=1 FL=1